MAIAEELVVQIRAEVDRAVKEMKRAEKGLSGIANRANKLNQTLGPIGNSLTRNVTLPLAAAGVAAIKFATDAQESINAVNVVFGESADTILEWGENAATQAGLSSAEFNSASTVIGAALLNAGIASDDAADSAINLTKRAADMASVFNTDVDQALGAIQAALRGEIDPIERFGVGMNAASVEAKALELGLIGVGQEMTQQALTTARLAVIMEQTDRVAGDFVNTSGDLANNSRVLLAQLKDQAAEIGANLLPVVNQLVNSAGDLVKRFGDLTEEQQKTIVVLAAVAAGAGPAIKGIQGLSAAIAFLAANPIVLAIAGVTALTAGIVKLSRNARSNQLAAIAEEFEGIESASRLATEEIEAISEALRLGSLDGFTDATEQVKALAANLGVSERAVVDIGIASDNVTDQYKEQLQAIKDQQVERIRLIALSSQEQADRAEYYAALAASAEIERQRVANAEAAAAAEAERLAAFLNVDKAIRSGLLNEEEGLRRKLSLRQDEIDRLKLIAAAQGTLNDEQLSALRSNEAQVRVYKERLAELESIRKAEEDIAGVILPEFANQAANIRESMEGMGLSGAIVADELAMSSDTMVGFKGDSEETLTAWEKIVGAMDDAAGISPETADEWKSAAQAVLSVYNNLNDTLGGSVRDTISAVGDLQQNIHDREIANLERIRDQYERGSDAYEWAQTKIDDANRENVRNQFEREKKLGIVSALINGAIAITKAYATMGPIAGTIAAVGIAALTAVQVAAISNQQVPLAAGGVVTRPTNALIGEAGPEAVIPLDRMDSMGGGTTVVNAPNITVNGSLIHERQLMRYITGGQRKLSRGY